MAVRRSGQNTLQCASIFYFTDAVFKTFPDMNNLVPRSVLEIKCTHGVQKFAYPVCEYSIMKRVLCVANSGDPCSHREAVSFFAHCCVANDSY